MTTFETLEFDKILSLIASFAHSTRAKEQILALHPLEDTRIIADRARIAFEASKLLKEGTPPVSSMDGLELAMPLLMAGGSLTTQLLNACAAFLSACRRMQLYLERMQAVSPELSGWGLSLNALPEITSEIERCIRGELVDDRATPTLRDLRRQIDQIKEKIRSRMENLLKSHPDWFMESFISQRGDRLVLPLKKAYRKNLPGAVADISASGSTLFVEPAAVSALRDELSFLQIEENNEVLRILSTLSAMLGDELPTLKQNRECLERLDFYFALGKLTMEKSAVPGTVVDKHMVRFEQGRHPLLPKESCIPLDFFLGAPPATTGVVITGPNTGGKTVSLKTVGLFCLMAQSGIPVPCKEGAVFPLLKNVLCDLGDGQSIEQNLSTFSSHVTKWVQILKECGPDTLVLCDELGAGTDPQEGMGLAVAMLRAFAQTGCLILATTHYPEVKVFAAETEGFINASMAFDAKTLSPLYRMELGKAGESCALLIAQRLGLPGAIIEDAAGQSGSRVPSAIVEEAISLPAPPETEQPSARPGKAQVHFEVGESVFIHPLKRTGIVAAPANPRGEVQVVAAGKKYMINQKRLSPHLSKEQLYPDADNYDLSIVLDSVSNRKARHQIERKHDKNAVIIIDEGHPQKT